ncbi:MAG: preprotein translocase subunit SecE [Mangrovicoccus sp.]|nr:preprotein translocase subunit SecE [Mangrovicoccus sp.]
MASTKTNPLQFIQQVRGEMAKIAWPGRREVAITTVMVFLMATVTAIFFFFVDWFIRTGLTLTLNFFGS